MIVHDWLVLKEALLTTHSLKSCSQELLSTQSMPTISEWSS